jgi:integrase
MYQDYDRAASKVIDYLTKRNCAFSIIYMNKRCFRLFKEYMIEKNIAYSQELIIYWLEDCIRHLCSTTFRCYRLALFRLNDVLENRQIATTKSPLNYQYLNKKGKELWGNFLVEISRKYSIGYIQEIRNSVFRFLIYALTHKVVLPDGITHKLIFDYYQDDIHRSQKLKNHSNGDVRIFLRYLAEKKLIRASVVALLDPLTMSRFFFIDDLPAVEKSLFPDDKQADSMAPEDFLAMAMRLDKRNLDKHRYSPTMRDVFRKTWKELFVFLEANELEYSQKLALCWATYLQHYTVQWRSFRRGIRLFEQYRNNGDINPYVIYRCRNNRAQELPEWCRGEYDNFIEEQQRKGFATSTISMNRVSVLRFLGYLSRASITDWVQLTPEIIKDFHLSDPHSTPEGKNAYAAKIRQFLEYLADYGIVPSYLQLALSRECAPRTNIIKTLESEDIAAIYDFTEQAQSGYQLRQCAIVMLGLRMGIRACDITKLKLSDISWSEATISVQQNKTDKFIKLPMPTEVGNCLYRYIMHGRPATPLEYIFINHKVPYGKLNSGACTWALRQALTKDPHGFHITRKTFASRMLCGSIKPAIIAESLGHSDNSTVMTYLATDGDSMRKCAITLEGIEVTEGVLS